jgi:hypothetical protein
MNMEIIISCMDRRLHGKLDAFNDGETFFLRNAGANVFGLKETLRQLVNSNNISAIKVMPHTDCGAMKLVSSVIKDGAKVDAEIDKMLVEQFKHMKFSSRDELERANLEIQLKHLKDMFPGINVAGDLIDIKDIEDKAKGHSHVLYIAKPSTKPYSEIIEENPFNTYVVQALSREELYPDIKIAVMLGQEKVFMPVLSREEERMVKMDFSVLGMRPDILPEELRESIEIIKRYSLPTKIK